MRQRMTPEQIVSEVKQSPAAKVKVAVADLDGVLRGKTIHRDKFLSAVESGFGFCNVVFGWDCNDAAYDNVAYTGWHTGYPDAQAHIDLNTFRKVPWDNDLPFFLADFVDGQGGPLDVCPRSTLKKAIAKASDMGFSPLFGMEFEWFNFRETPQSLRDKSFVKPEPLSPGMFGYSMLRAGLNQGFVNALFDDMRAFDVPVEGLHTETGPGVFEAAILYSDALEAADRGVLFKSAAKEIGYRFGVIASFMAKWHADLPGSGGHMHQSLLNAQGKNAFYDAAGEHGMSTTFKHYLAGQMHCLPHLTALYAPTINSYKRLVEGAWAPTRVTWGTDNRTTALRVITGGPRQHVGDAGQRRGHQPLSGGDRGPGQRAVWHRAQARAARRGHRGQRLPACRCAAAAAHSAGGGGEAVRLQSGARRLGGTFCGALCQLAPVGVAAGAGRLSPTGSWSATLRSSDIL